MRRNTVTVILLGLYVLALGFYWFGPRGTIPIAIRDVLYLLTPLSGVIGGIFALRVFGTNGPRGRTLVLLTLGMAGWFIGEVIFDYYLYTHSNPFPSIADVFYLLAYPLLFFGLINEVLVSHVNWKKLNRAVLFLLIIAALAIGGIVSYFGVYLAYDSKENFLTNAIAIGYGIGDLLLIIVNMQVVVLALEFRGGKLSRTWVAIFLSFIFTLIADILFAIYTEPYKANVWFYKSLLDTFWMTGYLLFAYGLFSFGFSIKEAHLSIGKLEEKNVS